MTPSASVAERAGSLASRVSFAIVTALPKEYAAAKAMLDRPVPFRASGCGAMHDYLLGEIPARGSGTHAVALLLADQGNPTSAALSAAAIHDFPDLNAVIMVGIAGGVPHPAKPENHVRLGDIVATGPGGIVKYDFVKEHRDRIEPKPAPRPPSAVLSQAARRLEAAALEGLRPWEQHIARASSLSAMRPPAEADRLAETADPSRWVVHPADPDRRVGSPRVFLGTIGAADRLQKNAVTRDALRDQFSVRAIEMEGAGVAEAAWLSERQFFAVRGICDYCDDHKNDVWQPYAAVVAAAYTRALLEEVAPLPDASSSRSAGPTPLHSEPPGDPPTPNLDPEVPRPKSPALRVGWVDADAILEAEYHAQLDGARELLRKGHAALAREALDTIKTRIFTAAPPAVRARVLCMIGFAEFDMGRFDLAGRALVSALEHASSDPKTQANAALGHALLGNIAAATAWAQKAIDRDPTNIVARQVSIHHDERPDDVVLAEHESVVGRRTEVLFALGQRAGRQGDPSRAAEWFRKACEVDSASPDVLAGAGQSLLDGIIEKLDEATGNAELSDHERAGILHAEDLLRRAWNALKDDDVRRARAHWLGSLANAARLLGSHDAAVSASDEAIRIGGRENHLVLGRAALAADVGDFRRVVELVEGNTDGDPQALGLLALAKSNLGKNDEGVELWKGLLAGPISGSGRDQAERNLILTLLEAKRVDEARATLNRFLEEESSLARQLLASEAAARLGDAGLRDSHLQDALALATRETPRRLLVGLGDALARASRAMDAAAVYELCIDPERSERDARRLLIALHRAGRFQSALDVCRRIADARGPSRFTTEVESVIHEQLGDLARARELCEHYLHLHPDDSVVQLRLGSILLRVGALDALASLLARIRRDDATLDAQGAGLLSELLVAVGRRVEALDVLYRARLAHIDDPQAHVLYFSRHLVLGRDIEKPTLIEADVAVRLSGADAPRDWILLTDDANPDPGRGEYPLSHSLSRALLGKGIGDEVTFESAPHRRWRVSDLDSKYAFAHRQSLAQFGTRFPDDGSLEQHEVPADPEEFVESMRARLVDGAPRWDKILAAYGSGTMTVGAIGAALNRSPYEAMGIIAAGAHGLIAASNTLEERRAATALLDRPDVALVIDFTAFVVLDGLGVLDAVCAGRAVLVAQTTVDAFRREAARWRDIPDEGYMSLGVHEGRLQRSELTEVDVARNRDRFPRLLQWINDHGQVVPISAGTVEKHADKRDFAKALGACFWDSVLIATEPGRALLSDDLRLRGLARHLGVDGVASVHLMMAQRAAGRLESDVAATALVQLVTLNYRNVAVDPAMLEAAARLEEWRPIGAFKRVVETLRGPETRLASGVMVATEFFRLIWFGLVLPHQRDGLCLAVMDALAAGRDREATLALVRQAVASRFDLLPLAAKDFARVLNLWARMHLLG